MSKTEVKITLTREEIQDALLEKYLPRIDIGVPFKKEDWKVKFLLADCDDYVIAELTL